MHNDDVLEKLKRGNEIYIKSRKSEGDVSPELRRKTAEEGQHPYAIVIACSDSREIPEAIFSAGIGELFVIRVAGNVLDNHQLGSIEYAVGHLDANVIVVLGHTRCGAVKATIKGDIHSIKNPTSGSIVVNGHIGELIIDENQKDPADCTIYEV